MKWTDAMFTNGFSSRRQLIANVSALIALFTILHLLYSVREQQLRLLGENDVASLPGRLNPPVDYFEQFSEPQSCTEHLGQAYLEEFRNKRAQYCSSDSASQLMCFHAANRRDGRIDSFCAGHNAAFNSSSRKFQFACKRVEPRGIESNHRMPALDDFPPYMYQSGPGIVFREFVDIDAHVERNKAAEGITILVKREGVDNLWHSLLEIMSMTMSLDILQMTRSAGSLNPIFSAEDASRTQVVIADNHADGPYFDLWRLFANLPVVRHHDLPHDFSSSMVIVPLAGGSNPIWRDDWQPNTCKESELLQTFSMRVRKHFKITDPFKLPDQIVVTIIDRRGTRKLLDQDARIQSLRKQHRHTEVLIRAVDFADLPLRGQIEVILVTDVLVGVHGAGLTHALWLLKGSAVVEILPKGLNHKGFRNLAGALGHSYFSAHASKTSSNDDDTMWQKSDVVLDEGRWLKLVDVAIKTMYNKGRHNFDVV